MLSLIIVAATPDEITARFGALVDAGVQYIIVWRPDGETARLLAERVIPQVTAA